MSGTGHPTGTVLALLRAEGLAVALVMAVVAWQLGPPWWLVVPVLVAPDLALAGYAAGPRTGATLYNAAHSYLGPTLVAGAWFVLGGGALAAISALWALHIGMDRALGYGLKYPTVFGDTHLGRS
jgi:hypothetical protein